MFKTRVILSLIAIILVLSVGFLSFFFSDLSFWLTGRTTTRAFIVESVPVNCSVDLSQGLNMVSFPCETGELDFYSAFSDEFNNTLDFEYVFTFTVFSTKDPWKSFNPFLSNWTVQDIVYNLNRRDGYFIYMNESGTYHAEGLRFPHTDFSLKRGWNLVGYPSNLTKPVEEVLALINSSYVSVHSFQLVNGSKQWLHHYKGETGSLEYFVPGYAYWIYMENNAVWRVSW